jgi:predicted DCC family thiol-disulfide oxidoreductase YuxK
MEPPASCDLTVYYDGSCPLCRREIALYRDCRGAQTIAFVDVSEPGVVPGPDLDRDAALARFHVRDGDGRLRSGAAGFAALWERLPAWRFLARLAAVPFVLPAMEAFYRLFLRVRPFMAARFR